MQKVLSSLLFVSILLALPGLRAAETPTPFTLPGNDPIAILALPDGMDRSKVSVAVSKALVEEQWDNLNWQDNITIATTVQSKITIKVFAVSTSADVKFYVSNVSEKEVADEKFRRLAQRQIGYLEKTITAKLNLVFKKAKGDSVVDQAVLE
jgi:hypothetical protein